MFVPSWIHRNYGERVWKAAVDDFLSSYPTVTDGIRFSLDGRRVVSPSKTLEAICKRLSEEQKAKDAKLAAERIAPTVDEDAVRALISEALGKTKPARAIEHAPATVPAPLGQRQEVALNETAGSIPVVEGALR